MEGSLWRYGTDLGDLYRGTLTLRQLWVRVKALPADCPLWVLVQRDREENEATSAIDEAMAMFPKG